METKPNFLQRLRELWPRKGKTQNAAVRSRVDDSPGWGRLNARSHDYDSARLQELYRDTLEAWRKNPIAWRIIAITSDFVIGEGMQITSPQRSLNRFIQRFWNHPQNRLDQRLEAMCDELSRAGDLFVCLFRNPNDGMSYLRFVTKDRIAHIRTAQNDWERELEYEEIQPQGESRVWLSPHHPEAEDAAAVMLHYSINRPLGALMGESDLTTMIPWLLRYSRMLEDRVRLHWAVRAFLWLVTVPANRVQAKQEQYRQPPEAGSIVVKDESERWEVQTPLLRGSDASHDLKAVRNMIDAGSGYPPHWRGEPGDTNLATAQAMQPPTERHLLRRQRYFSYLLQDLIYQAYQRAHQAGATPRLAHADYSRLFNVQTSSISQRDHEALGRAAQNMAAALEALLRQLRAAPPALQRRSLEMVMRFAGERLSPEEIETLLGELQSQH